MITRARKRQFCFLLHVCAERFVFYGYSKNKQSPENSLNLESIAISTNIFTLLLSVNILRFVFLSIITSLSPNALKLHKNSDMSQILLGLLPACSYSITISRTFPTSAVTFKNKISHKDCALFTSRKSLISQQLTSAGIQCLLEALGLP